MFYAARHRQMVRCWSVETEPQSRWFKIGRVGACGMMLEGSAEDAASALNINVQIAEMSFM
jgi:hypothetical protein